LSRIEAAVVLIRRTKEEKTAFATFDFKDLNQYLLYATGNLRANEEQKHSVEQIVAKINRKHDILVQDAMAFGSKETFVTLSSKTKLTKVVEIFGGGVHRVIVTKDDTTEVIGVLSQFRLVRFLWENKACFEIIDTISMQQIKDLDIGAQNPISINGDAKLKEALMLMNTEGISSIAVVDNARNVIGNISTVDTKVSLTIS
jgi:CBS domain-containing protein